MDLIRAIQAISYLFLVLMLAMILIGMRNTTQIMTAKRTKELGTIRAIGLSRPRTRRMVTAESLLIASLGFAIGLACAIAVLLLLQAFGFEWSAGFDIFLRRGHLTWRLSGAFLLVDYMALCLMTLAGSLPAARRAAAVEPAAAMTLHE
jgi:putative ABC transport system permease protein